MSAESAQTKQTGFFSLDLPNFPTFKSAVRQHRTLTLIFFLIGYSLIIFSLIVIIIINQQLGTRAPAQASETLSLATAYGSQRHVFAQTDGRVIAVYLNQSSQVAAAISEDGGVNWQELPEPLVLEPVGNVAGAQDKEGNLHLVYETQGQITYQKVTTGGDPWVISELVVLDSSRLGHRPSLILNEITQLPLVAWSSEFWGTPLRGAQVLFLAAKADPTSLGNWCNSQRTSCGQGAFYFLKGSADSLGRKANYSQLHPVLAQMLSNGDLYLWWLERLPNGKGELSLTIGKKEDSGWKWGPATREDEVGEETAKNFTLSAFADSVTNLVLVAYLNKEGQAKTVAYTGGEKTELGSLGQIGDQLSLTGSEGKYYLLYRHQEGRVGLKKFTGGAWSPELWESPEVGGYPSAPSALSSQNLPFIYVTPENKVKMTSYNLVPPTPTPTLEPSPTASPSPTLEPSPTAIPTVTIEPTPTSSPTPTPTVEPTPTPTPTP